MADFAVYPLISVSTQVVRVFVGHPAKAARRAWLSGKKSASDRDDVESNWRAAGASLNDYRVYA